MSEHTGDPARAIASAVVDELREARAALLAVVNDLPETRMYRSTARAGWTIKHEIAHIAALDAELLHHLESTVRDVVPHEGAALRRLRGQAMHRAQELRLTPLRAHLADLGEQVEAAVARAGDAAEPHLRAQTDRVRAAVRSIRDALG